ncbi:MAG: endolytic transglycosylase MltG [Alphaproteobacteria bacterium]|nr:MAG: endolytic transglycosylase MltG [Alphaproteobacteria bacterium]
MSLYYVNECFLLCASIFFLYRTYKLALTTVSLLIIHLLQTHTSEYVYLPKRNKSKMHTFYQTIHNFQKIQTNKCSPFASSIVLALFSYLIKAQSGEYDGKTNFEIIKNILNKKMILRKITIPEGLSIHQVCELLNQCEFLDGAIDNVPHEGSILPETYFYTRNTKAQVLLTKMSEAFTNVTNQLWNNTDQRRWKNKNDWIIFASIIQKEAKDEEEMGLIASVFINRIEHNMYLDSDPCVIYGITNGKSHINRVLKQHIQINSDYNTYKKKGLPKTPICNPGLHALIISLNPPKSEYKFFHHRQINTVFSKSLNDHINSLKNIQNT